MKNAETPILKLVLYGAVSSLGSALMAECLSRQYEIIAILDDLNALAPRPGLRTKVGELFNAERVCESIAGGAAVVCLLDAPVLPRGTGNKQLEGPLNPVEQLVATQTLLSCMQRMDIKRLILVGDFSEIDDEDHLDFQRTDLQQSRAAGLIVSSLTRSDRDWTLINAPQGIPGLSIEHFSQISDTLAPDIAEPLLRLTRVAAGIADELQTNPHVGEHVNFVC
ncbi:NAD(P)H-binding protein [Pseudomonas sp. NA-150]|uniref:NAD(P)H-binding protein n=1 Tax=Pseudomonas sp. NA-150 TaxID=3367525 RepID=UPI0037C58D4A